jgi:hypothetical protein
MACMRTGLRAEEVSEGFEPGVIRAWDYADEA